MCGKPSKQLVKKSNQFMGRNMRGKCCETHNVCEQDGYVFMFLDVDFVKLTSNRGDQLCLHLMSDVIRKHGEEQSFCIFSGGEIQK